MRGTRLSSIILSLSLVLVAACGESAGSIDGLVTNSAGGAALQGATITTNPATSSITTGADGSFTLADVTAGTYTVMVSAPGFVAAEQTAEVVAGAATTVDFALAAEITSGDAAVTVTDGCENAALAGAQVTLGDETLTTDADGVATFLGLSSGAHAFTVTGAGFLPGEGSVDVTIGSEAAANVELECQSRAVAALAREALAKIADKSVTAVGPAQALFDNLYSDNDDTNNPVIVSNRSAEHYALGHIPGAINIPYKNIAKPESIAMLGDPSADTRYTAYCYTGHTAGIATGVMNILGYETTDMKFGMMAWTQDATVRVQTPYSDATDAHDFTTETTANPLTGDYDPPAIDIEGAEDAFEAARAAADAYLNREGMAPVIKASDLQALITDGDTGNDPFIISVRGAADYAKGHIPGAVNIPYTQIALEENLRRIPTDRKIVVYCYTGHTGAIATGILGTLGYDATNLKFGLGAWTTDATIRVAASFDDSVDSHDWPLNTGATP